MYLSLFDPVDPGVHFPSHPTDTKDMCQKYCMRCECHVALSSKHCSVCDRCCFEFDHHCIFLNNCIGTKNYRQFVALLVVCVAYESLYIYEGVKAVLVGTNNG
jgi:hypothetical protein